MFYPITCAIFTSLINSKKQIMKQFNLIALITLFISFQNLSAQIACIADVIVSLDDDGNARLRPQYLLASPIDPLAIYTMTPDRVFTCRDIGTPILITIYKRRGGVTESCTSTINIDDKIPRPVFTLSTVSPARINLGFASERPISPSLFVSPGTCEGCTFTILPTRTNCDNTNAPLSVTITATDRFCRTSTRDGLSLITIPGIGCFLRMSIRQVFLNRAYFINDQVPVEIQLTQLVKKQPSNQVFSHYFVSQNPFLDTKKAVYAGYDKLNANQKSNKGSVKLNGTISTGKKYLFAILTDNSKVDFEISQTPDEAQNLPNFIFDVVGSNPNSLIDISDSTKDQLKEVAVYNFQGVQLMKSTEEIDFSRLTDRLPKLILVRKVYESGKSETIKLSLSN
jgi:hypothetical protein